MYETPQGPLQPGQFYPNGPKPQHPPKSTRPYNRRLLAFFISLYIIFWIGALASGGFMRNFAIALYIGVVASILILDARGFVSLEGLIQWSKITSGKRILLGFLCFCAFPLWTGIYLVQVLATDWPMATVPVHNRIYWALTVGGIVTLIMVLVSTTTSNEFVVSPASGGNVAVIGKALPTKAPTSTPIPKPKLTPTRQTGYPLCSENVPNAPCVTYTSIQDAAAGEASLVSTSISRGIVKVKDDLEGSSETTLDAVQLQCFNIQQALWYMKSIINVDGSQKIIKSAFIEVDITFINGRQNTVFASCRLTSAIVDKIDKAVMWDDGDYVGAWALYDSTSFTKLA